MAGGNATSLGYRLHERQHFGTSIELDGVPQIPQTAHERMIRYGEFALTREMERQCDEAIEAACHVLQHRRLSAMRRPC